MGYDLDKLGLPRETVVIYAARTNSQYMRLAGCSWLLWDILVNLGTEVRCIWAGRTWSTPVTLYLLARYLPLFSQLFLVYVTFVPSSTALCRAGFSVDAVSQFVTTLCTHCILMYRLYALYDNVKVLVSMVAWTGVNTTATLVLVLWTQSRIIVTNQFSPAIDIHACSVARDSPFPAYFWTPWLPVFLTEIYLFTLAAWKLREGMNRRSWIESYSLRDMLITDSFKYFVLTILIELFQVISWSHTSWEAYTDPITTTALAIASTRLLLNVRKVSVLHLEESRTLYTT